MAKSSSRNITTDQVLESVYHLNSQDLRSMQSRLTTTGKELSKLAGTSSLNALLSGKEQASLRQAAEVVNAVKARIAHAKERKQRDEKRREATFKARHAEARKLALQSFPLPINSVEQCVEVVRVALVLSHLRILHCFYSADEFAEKWLSKARFIPANRDKAKHLQAQVRFLAREIQQGMEETLTDDQRDISTLLGILIAKADEVRPQVLKQQAEVIECWTAALSEAGVAND
jgi:hypothetical protein